MKELSDFHNQNQEQLQQLSEDIADKDAQLEIYAEKLAANGSSDAQLQQAIAENRGLQEELESSQLQFVELTQKLRELGEKFQENVEKRTRELQSQVESLQGLVDEKDAQSDDL